MCCRLFTWVSSFHLTGWRQLRWRTGRTLWVTTFVGWYNDEHLHSGIRFVTPSDRHAGRHHDVLQRRRAVYEAAKERHPQRWRGPIRNLDPIETVALNPEPKDKRKRTA